MHVLPLLLGMPSASKTCPRQNQSVAAWLAAAKLYNSNSVATMSDKQLHIGKDSKAEYVLTFTTIFSDMFVIQAA
jgi:hypothetical protein